MTTMAVATVTAIMLTRVVDDMMNRRMMVVMTATAMRVMMTITTMNDGAGDSDDFLGLEFVDARRSQARETHAPRSETPVHEAKRTQAEPKHLPHRAFPRR